MISPEVFGYILKILIHLKGFEMDKNPADEIAITAMLKRFAEQRLPRAMILKKKYLKAAH